MPGKASADDPVQLFPAESPQYRPLTRAVSTAWNATQAAFQELRRHWFEAVALEPTRGVKRALTQAEQHALDEAIAEFLRRFAGEDRSPAGFASSDTEDGILQQSLVLAHSVGAQRAVQLTNAETNPAFTASQRRALMEGAYARLSDGSALRFETRLEEIRQAMIAGFNAGRSPLEISRKLAVDLDGYEAGRLRTIVRTEMAIASEEAITAGLRAQGVQRYAVIGDPATDALCVSQQGGPYALDDADHRPPFHPNCYCSQIPHIEDEN